jgi:hypothetical protein
MFRTLIRSPLIGASAWLTLLLMGGVEARQAPVLGQISGVASLPGTGTLAKVKVQLRDLKTKQIVGIGTTGADGQFVFVVPGPGDYIVEIVSEEGAIMGTTAPIRLVQGAMVVSAVAVSPTAGGAASALAAGAASPAVAGDTTAVPFTPAGGAGASGPGASNVFGSSIGAVSSSANAAGAPAGTVPSRGTASPSQ